MGYSIVEKKAISKFVGKTLVQLRIRNNFGLEVLMIKQNKGLLMIVLPNLKVIMPDPNYVIQSDEI